MTRSVPMPARVFQRGFLLVEALVAIALFSLGVLALVAFQSSAISISGDSKSRSDAAFLANQIVARMWTDRTNVAAYALNATGTACSTASSANSSTHPPVAAWLVGVQGNGGTALGLLPGATDLRQQITVSSASEVTVTLCWRAPAGTVHRYTAHSQIVFN
jgi:type IV pilus assembly protein PilV